jgi:mannose-6-phosphate isomerase-like protein (cupin superfamily)
MIAIEVLKRKAFSSEKMRKVNLFETDNLFCDVYGLRPGQAQKAHSHHGADKVYYVLEGSGTFHIGEEEKVLRAGMIVLAPSGVDHGVENTSNDDLTLLVFMAPNPNRC